MQEEQQDAQKLPESPISFPDAPRAPSVKATEIVYARRTRDQDGRTVIVVITPQVSFFLPDTQANALALTSAGVDLIDEPARTSANEMAKP